MSLEQYKNANRSYWDELVAIHAASEFYNLQAFKSGVSTLHSIETTEIDDVQGKHLLHLQCHFGLDTLSWARLGAKVVGVDFSEKAIELAGSLAHEMDIPAQFICSDVYELPTKLNRRFDIVFTSYGVLTWLPDLSAWAKVLARFLKPTGFVYIVDDHPYASMLDEAEDGTVLPSHSYFQSPEPMWLSPGGSYADRTAPVVNEHYEWHHTLEELVSAVVEAGLVIESLREFPVCSWQRFSAMSKDKDGWWRINGDPFPLTFSLKARLGAG